jgi:hypothetical protein
MIPGFLQIGGGAGAAHRSSPHGFVPQGFAGIVESGI